MGEIPGSFSTCGGVNESAFVCLGHPAWQVALLVIPAQCCGCACLIPANSFFYPSQFCVGLLPGLSPPQGSSALASWWPPPLAALVLSFIHVVSSAGVEVSQTKSPSSRKWKLQIKQRRFVCLLSQLLPGPSERKLGKGGRQASVEGCWNPSREASAFVCFVIAYLSGCLLGLVKVKICLFPFFLFLLKPFTQMEMNRVLTLFTGIGVNGYLNDLMRSHWTLAVYCVSDAGFPLTNEQMNIHMTWKVSRSLGDSLAF